jgi:hypothetical protein
MSPHIDKSIYYNLYNNETQKDFMETLHYYHLHRIYSSKYKIKAKTIPVTRCGGPDRCEKSRLPHFLDNRLTDGGEVFSLTPGPPFTPQEVS